MNMREDALAQAATGANARPVMYPSIEICDAGELWMFQSRLGETSCQGGLGAPHLRCRRWRRRCFSLISAILPVSTGPSTDSPSISRSSARNSPSSGERSDQNAHQRSSAVSTSSGGTSSGEAGTSTVGSKLSGCDRYSARARLRSGWDQKRFQRRCAR